MAKVGGGGGGGGYKLCIWMEIMICDSLLVYYHLFGNGVVQKHNMIVYYERLSIIYSDYC